MFFSSLGMKINKKAQTEEEEKKNKEEEEAR
jgi:hypothetical protein